MKYDDFIGDYCTLKINEAFYEALILFLSFEKWIKFVGRRLSDRKMAREVFQLAKIGNPIANSIHKNLAH